MLPKTSGYFVSQFLNYIIIISFLDTAAEDAHRYPKGWGKRHTFALLAFLGFANVFAMRVNLSVAIVQMVKSPSNMKNNSITPVHISNNTGHPIEEIEACAAPEGKSQYFDEVFKNLVSNFMIL